MGIYDWFKKKKDKGSDIKKLQTWKCGHSHLGSLDFCPYCNPVMFRNKTKGYEEKTIKEYYDNGELKMIGTLHYTKCTSWGGPLDCREIEKPCVECFIPEVTVGGYPEWKEGNWKYYYGNGNLCNEGKYLNDKREGEWKLYDETGKLTDKITYKNGEVI
jgi:antitoxin component YwqK of YwqJK toxin-antitoxin module